MIIYAAVLGFIAVAEWFFWDEFQTRFNFIAVDYLVWTQEVWGNVGESYPMPAVIVGLVLFSGAIGWAFHKRGLLKWVASGTDSIKPRVFATACFIAFMAILGSIARLSPLPRFANQYHVELAKNGIVSFCSAFLSMELDYDRFYPNLPIDDAFCLVRKHLTPNDSTFVDPKPRNLARRIGSDTAERKWNVILVCMESMSADFMTHFGGGKGLTPNLDRLADEGLCFTKLYATGTRTVRGMEALTLCIPPTPGQAILYRPAGVGLRTIGTIFKERGYENTFIYGGDGRFDYMNRYFGSCGYTILDKPSWKTGEVNFETAWGACDEDAFYKAIEHADGSYSAGKSFHQFVMTTSNHRPFQFPAGKIPLVSDTGRSAAVMYADFAVGQFVKAAAQRPWFANTLFVFVADHCASSAGKMELDCRKYHIPAIVWNPNLVQPRSYDGLCSQVDLMPTVFGLMKWSYRSLFYGCDVLDAAPNRAFISNYQKVALLTPKHLAILKPNQPCSLYDVRLKTGLLIPNESLSQLRDDAISYYQTASSLFKSGGLKAEVVD